MVNYIYVATIYHDTTNVIGVDEAQELIDDTDFETHRASCIEISQMDIQETSCVLNRTYTQFKSLIDGTDVEWTDVKYITDNKSHTLYIISSEPL
jgi:hypothetical protein